MLERPPGHARTRSATRSPPAGWFRKVPSGAATGSFGFGAIALASSWPSRLGAWVLWVAGPAAADHHHRRGDPAQAAARPAHRRRAGRSATRSRASRPTSPPPRPTSSGSRRARTSSPATCRGRSSSSWPTAGPRSAATWWPWAGCPTRPRTGTSATTTCGASTPGFLTSSLTSAATPAPSVGQQRHRLRRRQLVQRRRLLRRRRRRRRRRQLVSWRQRTPAS